MWLGFLSKNYWSSLDHDLMASIWEKAISVLAGNLNSGRSYFITAVVILCHGWCSRTLWCYYWGKRYPFPKRPCCLGRPFCLPSLACMAAAIIPTPRCIIQILAALVWKCSCLHNFFDILSFLKNLVLFLWQDAWSRSRLNVVAGRY